MHTRLTPHRPPGPIAGPARLLRRARGRARDVRARDERAGQSASFAGSAQRDGEHAHGSMQRASSGAGVGGDGASRGGVACARTKDTGQVEEREDSERAQSEAAEGDERGGSEEETSRWLWMSTAEARSRSVCRRNHVQSSETEAGAPRVAQPWARATPHPAVSAGSWCILLLPA